MNNESKYKESNRRILSGFAWQGVTKLFVQLVTWGSTIYVARILDPTDYGIMAITGVFIALLTIFVQLGLSQGLVHKPEITERQEDAVFYFSILAALLAYGMLYLAAPSIADFYNLPELTSILRVASLSLIVASIKAVPFALAMRAMNFKYRSIVEMFASFSSAISVVVLVTHGYGVWSLIWAYLISSAVGSLAYLPLLKRIPRIGFRNTGAKDLFSYGLKIAANNVLYFFYSKSDIFLIGKFMGDKLLGFYSMAFELASIPLDKIGMIFSQVAFPALSRLQDDPEQSRQVFLRMHRYLLVVSYPIFIGLALVAEDLIVLLLTEKWLPMIPILQVLCFVGLLRVSGMILNPVLNARGKAGLVLKYAIFSAVVLPLSFLVGVGYGMNGVLAVWVIAYPILYSILLRYCLRDLEVGFMRFVSTHVSTWVASGLMIAAVYFVHSVSKDWSLSLRLVTEILVGALAYVCTYLIFFLEEAKEVRTGLKLLRGKG